MSPVRRTVPYVAGDVASFAAEGEWLEVESPSGQRFKVGGRRGRAQVWLAEPGAWTIAGESVEVEAPAESDEDELPGIMG